jgi:hypothetical protein
MEPYQQLRAWLVAGKRSSLDGRGTVVTSRVAMLTRGLNHERRPACNPI